MKKFIKKRNLGMIIGLTLFILVFIFYLTQFFAYRKAKKEISEILKNYYQAMDSAGENLFEKDASTIEKEYNDIFDKFWDDEDDVYSAKYPELELITKDKFKSDIKDALNNSLLLPVSHCTSSFYDVNITRVDRKTYEVSFYVNTDMDYTYNEYEDTSSCMVISAQGVLNTYQAESPNAIFCFKKVNGSWKIIGVNTDNSYDNRMF